MPDAFPFVNDWRTNIEMKIAIPSSFFRQSVTTPGRDVGGSYVFNNTCLADITYVITNDLITTIHNDTLQVSVKPGHKRSYPSLSIREFETLAAQLFPEYQEFLRIKFSDIAKGVHLITLPSLNVRPLVLGAQMCLFDQDWMELEKTNHAFYLAQCFLHQYFCASLLPYSPPIRFISDSLFTYYTIESLKPAQEKEDRLMQLFNQVLVDEEQWETSRVLFRDYLEEYPKDERSANKGAYVLHMMRLHFNDTLKFDYAIQYFMESL